MEALSSPGGPWSHGGAASTRPGEAGKPLIEIGGPERDRTAYLLNAIEALYQMSYRPG